MTCPLDELFKCSKKKIEIDEHGTGPMRREQERINRPNRYETFEVDFATDMRLLPDS